MKGLEATIPLRTYLLMSALLFVHAASKIEGVSRIALIGSLTKNKQKPKDIDLLVTVDDATDLAPLATQGRKLLGRTMSYGNCGTDIFLSTPSHQYLGRLCAWKVCQAGIRMRCDALHCGLRPYLHDDLRTITLAHSLIVEPPIELWPKVVARVPVPDDVQKVLIGALGGREV